MERARERGTEWGDEEEEIVQEREMGKQRGAKKNNKGERKREPNDGKECNNLISE